MVSVVIPVYNAIPYLESALNSVLIQNHVGEIILVEDGSTDESLKLCRSIRKSDPRILLFTHNYNQNKGAAESRNLGIKKARFPYIAFLDSDDVYFSNRFDQSIELLESNPEITGCYGKVLVNNLQHNQQKLMGVPVGMNSIELFSFLLNGGYFHTNSITIRKSVLLKQKGFNQFCWPHEDVELWIRLAYLGNLQSISTNDPIAEYKVHENNLSNVGNWKTRFNLWKTVYFNFFSKPISFTDRKNIIKQIIKARIQGFKELSFK